MEEIILLFLLFFFSKNIFQKTILISKLKNECISALFA